MSKIALVTGGSRGLGKNMALSLAKNGLDVVITYHSKKDAADEVVKEIQALGQKAATLQLAVDQSEGYDDFVKALGDLLEADFGVATFDYLVNNAGSALYQSFKDTTEAQFDSMVNIHLKSAYFLTQKLLGLLNNGGGIVNISSGLARFSNPGCSAYGAVKAAVETLTRYQALELGSLGIRSNVIAPGPIETDFGGGNIRDNAAVNKAIASQTALGRVGLPGDIGGVVSFLCSDAAQWVNGQRIEISGGIHL